ncbi:MULTISPECIES: DNA-binding protein [unclassified Variovorax]|uniref:DNA-binding protein n=1 Tax=unclassified Variovorax TaxID=663243 RepID=UPI0008385519|nr:MULTISPECIES: DNA-binding protein [unclassified Variovorax]VTU41455.1 hypothetical protein SRS16P1_00003 [Variovorax sp. SRS16]VTU41481.1 hypothetical protein E5P1_00003 [Variovorax sp. PBL-E5]VTU44848.1 hypothetical protein H6P1_00931 [Variovorax sp. PBL-H6]VTV17032.1 hypothetical protein WDL1P1_00003 [Variovorax sp. WDL1]
MAATPSDTRKRVREIADQLLAAGTAPTSTLVRKLLGKGSFETIVGELKLWEADRQRPLPNKRDPTAEALDRVGAQQAAELIAQAADASKSLTAAVASVRLAASEIASFPALVATLTEQVRALTQVVEDDRKAMRDELAKANARYEGVQKYAMTAIEAARAESRMLQEQLAQTGDKTGARESAYRQQAEDLRVLVHQLQGRLAEQGKRSDDVVVPPRLDFDQKRPVRLSSYEPTGRTT